MENRRVAYILAALLKLAGAAAGLLWAAYVFHGLVNQTGAVEPLVIRYFGQASLRIDFLIASLGALVYFLAGLPRRWLKASRPTVRSPQSRPTAPPRPEHPAAQGTSGRFRLSVNRTSPSVGERAVPPPAPVEAPTAPTTAGLEEEAPMGWPGRLAGWFVTAALFGALYLYFTGPGQQVPSAEPQARSGDPASSSSAAPTEPDPADADVVLLEALAAVRGRFEAWATSACATYAREFGSGTRPRRNEAAVLAPISQAAELQLKELAALVGPGPGVGNALRTRAAAYVTAARALSSQLDEAERYYGRRVPVDDGWAKGNALHAQLRAGQKEFAAAVAALDAEVRRVTEANRATSRAARLAGGDLRWVGAMDAVDQASALFDLLVRRQEKGDVTQATLRSSLATYQATVDALWRLARDAEGSDRELGRHAGLFPGVAQAAERFLRSALDAEREVRGAPGAAGQIGQATGQRLEQDLKALARDAGELSP
jgi:hypothetical protein